MQSCPFYVRFVESVRASIKSLTEIASLDYLVDHEYRRKQPYIFNSFLV
jgi:hypothetical protein